MSSQLEWHFGMNLSMKNKKITGVIVAVVLFLLVIGGVFAQREEDFMSKIQLFFSQFGRVEEAAIGSVLFPPEEETDVSETAPEEIFPQEEVVSQEEQTTIAGEPIERGEGASETVEEEGTGAESKVSLASLQEIIDDIEERVDIMRQEVETIIRESTVSSPFSGEQEVLPEELQQGQEEVVGQEPEETELQEEGIGEQAQETKKKRESAGGVGISYCAISSGVIPARSTVILNEIAWMGTNTSAANEWIELKNITGGEVQLAGWQVLDAGRQVRILFGGENSIPAGGLYLLERTDDTSVAHITADRLYAGALNNMNETLSLFDEECELQDEVKADPDWPAGDQEEKRSMERSSDLNWHTYSGQGDEGIMGTPRAENSLPLLEIPILALSLQSLSFQAVEFSSGPQSQTFTILNDGSGILAWAASIEYTSPVLDGVEWLQVNPASGTAPSEVLASVDASQVPEGIYSVDIAIEAPGTQGSPQQVQVIFMVSLPELPAVTTVSAPTTALINEIQIDSISGPGGTKDDWVELYNPNTQNIDLTGWSIQRSTESGTIHKKNFEQGHSIPARGYFLIVRNNARQDLLAIADMTTSALQLSSNSTIYLVKNQELIEGGDNLDIVDKVGFGQGAFSPEGSPALDPPAAKSITRKELGLDTNDNGADFEISDIPTPTNTQGDTL